MREALEMAGAEMAGVEMAGVEMAGVEDREEPSDAKGKGAGTGTGTGTGRHDGAIESICQTLVAIASVALVGLASAAIHAA